MQIAENAGSEGSLVLEKVKEQDFGFGWNAATDSYENLLETGVIDPATVTCGARARRAAGSPLWPPDGRGCLGKGCGWSGHQGASRAGGLLEHHPPTSGA